MAKEEEEKKKEDWSCTQKSTRTRPYWQVRESEIPVNRKKLDFCIFLLRSVSPSRASHRAQQLKGIIKELLEQVLFTATPHRSGRMIVNKLR